MLSWYGVHTVVSGTAYDPPRALPIAGGLASPSAARSGAEPEAASTHRPRPSPTSGTPGSSLPSASSKSPKSPKSQGPPDGTGTPGSGRETGGGSGGGSAKGPYDPSGNVESHNLRGGRVAFDLGPASATLVSATPNAGWEMQVWRAAQWIRVTFTRGDEASSVFCTWHDGPPRVTVDEHAG